MVAAVRVHKTGGPEVLTYEDVEVPAPGRGQIEDQEQCLWREFHRYLFPHGHVPIASGNAVSSRQRGAGEVTAVGPGVPT